MGLGRCPARLATQPHAGADSPSATTRDGFRALSRSTPIAAA